MKSIYGKLILGFLISVILSFSIVGIVIVRRTRTEIAEGVLNELKTINSYITNELKNDPSALDDIDKLADSLGVNIIYSTKNDYHEVQIFPFPSSKLKDEIYQFSNSEEMNYSKLFSNVQTVGFKIQDHNDTKCIFIQKDISSTNLIFKNAMVLSGCLIFMVGSIIFLIIADVIVKPLRRLSNATVELAKGNYNVKVNYQGQDELSTLSDNFNLLAKQLGETEKTRQRFISEISHEFQTPLTSIQGFATILKNENLDSEQKERYSDIILFESKRLSTLSKNMLQLTLLEGEDVKLDLSTFCLNEQLTRVASSLQDMADQKNIEIEIKLPKRDVMIEADENRLEQVWINLINNAIKYTDDNGYISVNLKRNVASVEISINDTGIGMSDEAKRHIFERFYREDKARSIGGNGLGFSIVKSIIDLHNGKINVISQKDVGSEFHIFLPIKQK